MLVSISVWESKWNEFYWSKITVKLQVSYLIILSVLHGTDYADNRASGLQLAMDNSFDIIILDLMLPMNGWTDSLQQTTRSRQRNADPDADFGTR